MWTHNGRETGPRFFKTKDATVEVRRGAWVPIMALPKGDNFPMNLPKVMVQRLERICSPLATRMGRTPSNQQRIDPPTTAARRLAGLRGRRSGSRSGTARRPRSAADAVPGRVWQWSPWSEAGGERRERGPATEMGAKERSAGRIQRRSMSMSVRQKVWHSEAK